MIEDLTRTEYDALLRPDFPTFAARCFHQLNPQTDLADGTVKLRRSRQNTAAGRLLSCRW